MKLPRRKFLKSLTSGMLVPAFPAIVRAQALTLNDPVLGVQSASGASNGLLNGLVAYWKLDETGGPTRADSVGANTLLANGAIVATSGIINNATKGNGFLSLGSNSNVTVGSGVSISFSGWFKAFSATGGTTRPFLSKWTTFQEYALFTWSGIGNRVAWAAFDLSNSGHTVDTGLDILSTLNTWYHIAFGYDDVNQVLWSQVNAGTRQTLACVGVRSTTDPFELLNWSDNSGFSDYGVDELALYHNRVLSTGDVSKLYNSGAGYAFSNFTN